MSDLPRLKQDIISKLNLQRFYCDHLVKHGTNISNISYGSDGWSTKVTCPFHNDRTPSFVFNIATGGYKCFACSAKGSIFDFWCISHGLDKTANFKQAVEHLCEEAGMDMPDWIATAGVSISPIDANRTPAPDRGIKIVNKAKFADESTQPITKGLYEEYCKALGAEQITYLNRVRGLTLPTIKRYLIGFDTTSKSSSYVTKDGTLNLGRYTIPVFNQKNECRNIRRYGRDCEKKTKMLNTKGYGSPARLFCLNELMEKNWEHVIICEGEFDCMLLNQELSKAGINDLWGAVTGTAGVLNFEPEWLEWLYNRSVYIMFDCDKVGRAAASSHATKFFLDPFNVGRFRNLKIVTLPLDGTEEHNDITDYFTKAGGTIEELIKLCNTTSPIEHGGLLSKEASIGAIEVSSFDLCLKDRKYIDKRVTVPICITGNTSKVYHAAREYTVKCPLMEKGTCCNMDEGIKIIPYGHELFIQSCMANKNTVATEIQAVACTAGQPCSIKVVSKIVMEEFYASQVVPRWRAEENAEGRTENVQQLTTAPVYILQPENSIPIKPQDYMATGWVRTHPNTQNVTFFVESMEPLQEDWRSFSVNNPGVKDQLNELRKIEVADILEQLTNGVTQIYESDHILLTVLLTYLSPLRFIFNEQVTRGWINSCIIGDSGTGKSATYMRISDWLELGDLFSVLTGKRTGLLYSLKQKANDWYVNIGRYVMASGKIIAVDETQEMETEEIQKMAIAMDTGVLEVSQVASGRYQTETRTIFLMNPKNGRTISDYGFGCKALRDCFDPRFIRRLDIAIFCTAKNDFSFYNQQNSLKKANITITSDMFKHLIYWAWTRTVNDIKWTEDAEKRCFEKAIELSNKFGQADDVPLVSPTDIRLNIARLSTAYSILSCSFTDDMEGATVLPQHVDVVAGFIDAMYSDISCNLFTYSTLSGRKKVLNDYEKIRDAFNGYIRHTMLNAPNEEYRIGNYFCQLLLILQQNEYIRKNDLRDQLNLSANWIQKHIATLQARNLVEIYQGGYKTTRKFNLFMSQWRQEKICLTNNPEDTIFVHEMLDQVYAKVGDNTLSGKGLSSDALYHQNGSNGYSGGYVKTNENEFERLS